MSNKRILCEFCSSYSGVSIQANNLCEVRSSQNQVSIRANNLYEVCLNHNRTSISWKGYFKFSITKFLDSKAKNQNPPIQTTNTTKLTIYPIRFWNPKLEKATINQTSCTHEIREAKILIVSQRLTRSSLRWLVTASGNERKVRHG